MGSYTANPASWSQTLLPKCSSPIYSSKGFSPYLWVKKQESALREVSMTKCPLKLGQTLKIKWIRGICLRRTPICQVVHQKKERKHKVVVTMVSSLGSLSLKNVMVGSRHQENRAKGRDSAERIATSSSYATITKAADAVGEENVFPWPTETASMTKAAKRM